MHGRAAVVLLFITSCAGPALMKPKPPFTAVVGPLVIAHRGGSLEAPENTVAAVRHGTQAGAEWIEIDVTLTSDGEVVVIHDDTLERTTNGKGEVTAKSLKELQALYAGRPGWSKGGRMRLGALGLTPPDFGERFADARVPSLREVLAETDARLMIELKKYPRPEKLVDAVLRVVYEANAAGRVGLGSFEADMLWAAYNRDPSISLIGIAESESEIKAMFNLPITVIAVDTDLAEFALLSRPSQLAVWCWTAYTPEQALALRDLGVNGIITDAPAAVLPELRKPPPVYMRAGE